MQTMQFMRNAHLCNVQKNNARSTDVNQSGEIDVKDFEMAIEVSARAKICQNKRCQIPIASINEYANLSMCIDQQLHQ